MKIAGEDVPVIVSGKTEGNKVPVRTIDDDGVISKDVRQVPVDMFPKTETPAAAAKTGAEPTDMTKS